MINGITLNFTAFIGEVVNIIKQIIIFTILKIYLSNNMQKHNLMKNYIQNYFCDL